MAIKIRFSLAQDGAFDLHCERWHRRVDMTEVARLADLADREYFADDGRTWADKAPQLADLGKKLFRWLDGAEGWLRTGLYHNASTLLLDLSGPIEAEELNPQTRDLVKQLAHLPWELLHDEVGFLAEREVLPVRMIHRHGVQIAPANRPLRLLFMATSPEEVLPELDFEDEEARISEATRRQPIQLMVEESGCIAELKDIVASFGAGEFDVFHITGHGIIKRGQPYFVTETEIGERLDASAEDLASTFGHRWARLMFLNGCHTAHAQAQGMVPSMAHALIKLGAPAVLGWARPVYDKTGIIAATALYAGLAIGETVTQAVSQARSEMLREFHEHPRQSAGSDWHLLRLYQGTEECGPLVTPLRTKGRQRVRPAASEEDFLDADRRVKVAGLGAFFGRRRVVQRCMKALRETGDYRGVLLHGMGGLGKSTIAARISRRHEGLNPHFERVVLIGPVDEAGLRGKLIDRYGNLPEVIQILNRPLIEFRQQLRDFFSAVEETGRPLLLVLDDFEQNIPRHRVDDGSLTMTAAAYSTVDALCFALQEPGVASRLIITCRYFSETAWPAHKLFVESLTRLRQADAVRKVEFLLTGANAGDRNAEREKRILGAAYGNPRLLEWLLKIPRDVAGAEMLTQLEQVAESFRENTLARVLVRALDEAERKALARLSLFRLPVPMTAVEAMADGARVERSVGLGLIEKGEVQGEELLAVPVILDPILQAALTDQEWAEARKRAARFALKVWWDEPERPRYDRMTEVMRLGMEAGEREIAVKAGDWVAISWINTGRHVEALAISKPLLERFDDYRTASTMASAEEVLGQVEAALGHYEHAIATCPPTDRARLAATLKNLASVRARLGDVEKAFSQWKESLDIWDSLSDAPGKASTLRDMALVVAQTGDLDGSMNLLKQALILQSSADEGGRARILHEIARLKAERKEVAEALEIWEEALVIMNRHGDLQGVAAALHEMGRAIAQRGEWVDAERCWERSLEISNNIKDLRTQAATLHEMAIMALTQDKSDQAMELWQKSLDIETRIRNLPGMAATLNHMAMVAANRGTDDAGAEALYRQSVEVSAASRAYRDLATALSGLGMITREGKAAYLAQAVWLMIHTEAAPEKVVLVLTRLFEWAPSGDPIEALLAAMVQHLVAQRGQNHPMATELYEQGGSMLGAAAINAGHKDAVSVWVSELRLADMPSVQLRLDACLESLVGDNWLFDRSLLTETG